MIIVGCADEFVVADVEHIGNLTDFSGDFVNVLLRSYACGFRNLLYFLSVFVRSGEEEHILADETVETCYCVRQNNLICIADMRCF